MSQNALFALLDTTVREAENFSQAFFKQVDKNERAPSSIQPNTTIVWNGTPLAGPSAFEQMVKQTPTMVHSLTGLDVQPFPNGDSQAINMNVSVSGSVRFGQKYNKDEDYGFSAQLVVRRLQPGAPLVLQTMSYRLVHKPPKSEIQT